jgi:hypothetical protein
MLADWMQYQRIYASHDWAAGSRQGGGWTKKEFQAYAATVPKCVELARADPEDAGAAQQQHDTDPAAAAAAEEDEDGEEDLHE